MKKKVKEDVSGNEGYFYMKQLRGRTENQTRLLDSLLDYEVPYVVGLGPAGTGKSLCAMYAALKGVQTGQYKKIILSRPVVEAGENLGFLPGTFEDKINPYMAPLFDAIDSLIKYSDYLELKKKNIVEIIPLAFTRGRNFSDAYVILDEAQNSSIEQIKMIVTRLNAGSKIAVLGDNTQIDLKPQSLSGLEFWLNLLEETKFTHVHRLTNFDIQRREEVSEILRLFDLSKKVSN